MSGSGSRSTQGNPSASSSYKSSKNVVGNKPDIG